MVGVMRNTKSSPKCCHRDDGVPKGCWDGLKSTAFHILKKRCWSLYVYDTQEMMLRVINLNMTQQDDGVTYDALPLLTLKSLFHPHAVPCIVIIKITLSK